MSTNIYDLANSLERAIRQLPEYQAVFNAKKELSQDKLAAGLFDEYIALQKELQELMQLGQIPSEELQSKMQDLSKRLEDSPLVAEYFIKQQQLSVYLADIERIIFQPLNDLMS